MLEEIRESAIVRERKANEEGMNQEGRLRKLEVFQENNGEQG